MQPGGTQIVTLAPDGTSPRWLGALGHVRGVNYGFTLPGGPDQLACVLEVPANYRTDALNPGRICQAYRGGQVIWDGKLLEPAPAADGWAVTAIGAGNAGADFVDIWSTWTNVNDHINQAIARGLRWVNPGQSNTGLWFGQQIDSGSQYISDLLSLVTTNGGKTWQVNTSPQGNVLSIFDLPTAVDRTLVCTTPVARTLGGDLNSLYARYQVSADAGNAGAATYALVNKTTPVSVTEHGAQEAFIDLSSAGTQTATTAGNAIANVLKKYQRASFAGPFVIRYGELLTPGGTPIDLGMETAGHVCKLVLADFGYGGEIVPGPVQFLTGAYVFDDDSQTAQVTPFQNLDLSLSGLLSALGTVGLPALPKKPKKPVGQVPHHPVIEPVHKVHPGRHPIRPIKGFR